MDYIIKNGFVGTLASCGSGDIINNNEQMKEEKLTKHKIVFQETTTREYTYNVLAETKQEALNKIEKGGERNDSSTISIERKLKE